MFTFDFGCDHVRKQIKQRENENAENNQVEIKNKLSKYKKIIQLKAVYPLIF